MISGAVSIGRDDRMTSGWVVIILGRYGDVRSSRDDVMSSWGVARSSRDVVGSRSRDVGIRGVLDSNSWGDPSSCVLVD